MKGRNKKGPIAILYERSGIIPELPRIAKKTRGQKDKKALDDKIKLILDIAEDWPTCTEDKRALFVHISGSDFGLVIERLHQLGAIADPTPEQLQEALDCFQYLFYLSDICKAGKYRGGPMSEFANKRDD